MHIQHFLRVFAYLFYLPKVNNHGGQRFDRIRQTVKRLRTAILLVLGMIAIGTVGYMAIEGVGFFDAYYMTIITLGSVGYGEVFKLSLFGRFFTTLLIIFNLGLFTYAISTIAHIFTEGGFSKLISAFTMLEKIERLKNHTIVCGFGRHAMEVTKELSKQGAPFVVIEQNPEKIQALIDHTDYFYIDGDATHDIFLQEAGIDRASSIVITLPDDADNIFVVITARQLNPKLRIICRANQQEDEIKLRRAGADHVVMPERIGGFYMATLVKKPDLVEFFNLISNMGPDNVVFEELAVKDLLPKYQGRTIEESRLVADCRIPIVAIRDPNGDYALNPPAQTSLRPDTHIVVFGNPEQMQKFRSMAMSA